MNGQSVYVDRTISVSKYEDTISVPKYERTINLRKYENFNDKLNLLNKVKVKLATIVEGDPKAPFSIATTPRCRGGRYSIKCWNERGEEKCEKEPCKGKAEGKQLVCAYKE